MGHPDTIKWAWSLLPMLYLYPCLNAFSCGVKVLVLESVLLSLKALLRESYPVRTNILHAKHHSIPLIPSVLLAWLLTLCLLVTPHSAAVSMCLGSHKNMSKITLIQMFKRFQIWPLKTKITFTLFPLSSLSCFHGFPYWLSMNHCKDHTEHHDHPCPSVQQGSSSFHHY